MRKASSLRPSGSSTLTVRGVVPRAMQKPVVPTSPREDLHWLVRRWGSGSRRPKVMHPTREAAIAEATRLATYSPGVRFNVYECRVVQRVLK